MTSHSDPDEAGVFSSAAHSTGAQGSDLGEEARTLDRTPSGASYELGENALSYENLIQALQYDNLYI